MSGLLRGLLSLRRPYSQFSQVPFKSTSVTAGMPERFLGASAGLPRDFLPPAVPPAGLPALATPGRCVIATFTSSRHDTSPQLVQTKCG